MIPGRVRQWARGPRGTRRPEGPAGRCRSRQARRVCRGVGGAPCHRRPEAGSLENCRCSCPATPVSRDGIAEIVHIRPDHGPGRTDPDTRRGGTVTVPPLRRRCSAIRRDPWRGRACRSRLGFRRRLLATSWRGPGRGAGRRVGPRHRGERRARKPELRTGRIGPRRSESVPWSERFLSQFLQHLSAHIRSDERRATCVAGQRYSWRPPSLRDYAPTCLPAV